MNGDRHTERNGRHSLRLQVSYASWGTKLPKAKDHRPSIADWEQVQGPCGAARNGHSCPDRVKSCCYRSAKAMAGSPQSADIRVGAVG
jgi:hypothetical protein